MIYFVQDPKTTLVKIGTTGSVERRVQQLIYAYKLDGANLLFSCPGDAKLERRIHRYLRVHQHQGEWFRDHDDVRNVIEAAKAGTLEDLMSKSIRQVDTVADLIALWGTDRDAAKTWGIDRYLVQRMRQNNMLTGWHLQHIYDAAERTGRDEVTIPLLFWLAAKPQQRGAQL